MQEATSESAKSSALSEQELCRLDAYWRAANYLSVGQIYLLDNPLLREPLKPQHIKPRLLGHWAQRRDSISSMPTSTASSSYVT